MARQIDKLSAAKVREIKRVGRHSDGGGLYLQVARADGKRVTKSWLFQYTSPTTGKVRQMGLGPLHTFSLAEAREDARRARQLVKQGIDPIEEQKKKKLATRAEQVKTVTFKEMAEQYLASHRHSWKGSRHAKQWLASFERHVFPIIGGLAVGAIDRQLVLKVVEPIWRTKTQTATRVRERIASVLDMATVRELRSGPNPAQWKGALNKLLPAPRKVKPVKHYRVPPLPGDRSVRGRTANARGHCPARRRVCGFDGVPHQ